MTGTHNGHSPLLLSDPSTQTDSNSAPLDAMSALPLMSTPTDNANALLIGSFGPLAPGKADAIQRAITSAAITNAAAVASSGPITSVSVVTPKTDTNSQVALGADVASSLYGVTGAGLKIGIISDSFNNLGGQNADVTSGDLPGNVTVVRDLASGGSDEGRAMTELAYKIAPGAQFYFSSGYADPGSNTTSIQACANAVQALQAKGCNVIIDDLGFGTAEGFFQVGTVLDNAITAAVASGVSYFSAAGNDGKAYYQQGFTALTTTFAHINGGAPVTANNFGGATPTSLSLTIAASAKMTALFEWAQPFASIGTGNGGSKDSLAIYLLDSAGNVVASSTADQIGLDPTQSFSFTNPNATPTTYQLVVVQNGGTVTAGELFKVIFSDGNVTVNNPNANQGSGNIYGHELVTAQNSVAAVNYAKTPAFGVATPVPTSFSSVGTGSLLFDANGNPLTTPVNAGEPNFAGAQGSGTAVPGFTTADGGFNGTSAAAPNVGAVSALVLQANTRITPPQMTSLLAQSTIPIATTLPDSGAGLVQARAAVEIGADYLGASWTNAAGGDWTTAGSWSTTAVPVSAKAAILDNNLGSFSSRYTVTVTTGGNVAGSLAVVAPTGSSATLAVGQGGSLAIGGSNATNITAGDFLLSNNGVLALTGGTLSIAGSLNSNNGTVTATSGSATANNYAQIAGTLSVGGGTSAASLTLTGTGLTETGGTISVGTIGNLVTTSLTDTASPISVTAASGSLQATGTVSLTNATIGDAGTFTAGSLTETTSNLSVTGASGNLQVTSAASFTGGTLGTAGTFSAASALFTQAAVTDTGKIVTSGTLGFVDTAATVANGASITAGALVVGTSFNGYTPTLTVAGQVNDTGDLTRGSAVNGGTVIVQSTGIVSIGGTASDAGILFTGKGVLQFTSANTTVLQGGNSTVSSLNTAGGTLDFSGLTYATGVSYSYNATNGQLAVFDPNGVPLASILLNKADNYTTFTVSKDAGTGIAVTATACYCAGTRILTEHGERPVESLIAGDRVMTQSGTLVPVRWIGMRRVDFRHHPDPASVQPVRIRAGAFGAALPTRDLLISPEHAVFADGMLVPARMLVGCPGIAADHTILSTTYYHIELPAHDVILAEGLPCESWLDTGNRSMFENADTAALHFSEQRRADAAWSNDACAPLAVEGPALDALRLRLGGAMAQDVTINRQGSYDIIVEPGAGLVRLLTAAHSGPVDCRLLGAAITTLMCDDTAIPLTDHRLARGFHTPEEGWRWTDGAGVLDLGASASPRLLRLDIAKLAAPQAAAA